MEGTIDETAVRERLQQMLAALDQRDGSDADGRATVELDQTRVGRLSRMDALQGQAMAQETARRRQQERQRIVAALRRLDNGEYGACVRCGEEIAGRRLQNDPAVPTCIGCAA